MYICIYRYVYMEREVEPYVGNLRSEKRNSESRFFLAHLMNPCKWIQRHPRGLPVALAKSRIH